MNKKSIDVRLTKNSSNQIVLRFNIDGSTHDINLETNDSESIKSVFILLARELRTAQLNIEYAVDTTSIDNSKDELFIDSADEYIKQLKSELLKIENDADLQKLRENNN